VSLFVVGTDTEVGKTVTCAALLARFGKRLSLGYWKPIATGANMDRDTDTVRRLAGAYGTIHDELYLYDLPVSPHLAARRRKNAIEPARVRQHFRALQRSHPDKAFIVEGVGGVLVPISDSGLLLADLVRGMRLACVVVTRSTLGTINHTLLTVHALRHRNISIAGVIMNGPRNRDNRNAIERFGNVPVVGELEIMKHLSRNTIADASRHLDRRARLKPYLTSAI
jgi:dethiobiotin synthase